LPASPESARRARVVFGLQIALAAAGLAAVGAALAGAAGSVHRVAGSPHEVLVAGQRLTYPAVNAAAAVLLLLAGIGAIVLATMLRGVWTQIRAYRRFVQSIPLAGPLPGYPGVNVIEDQSAQAFCAGYLRPRVYISRGALELLSSEELRAVLSHEARHRSTRDPLRFACARLLSQALFFLPALRPLGHHYEELAEQTADAAAVRASAGDGSPLAAALLAFDSAAPSGTAGISNARVDALLGQPLRLRLPTPLILLSLAMLAGFVVLVWRTSAVASAEATFNLPVLSSQPCMLMLALLPAAVVLLGHAWHRRMATRPARHLVAA
jgi:bla regulator protein blaR1